MNPSLENAPLEECPEIPDNQFSQNYLDDEFEITREVQLKSDDSIINNYQNTDTISSGMDTRSLKKFSPFTQRSNISGSSEHISTLSSETTLVKGIKYTFYDDNGEKFIIDNTDFDEEEEELIDIFKSNSTFVPNNSHFEMLSYNENFHFFPIQTDVSSDDSTDEKDIIGFEEEEKKLNNILNPNLAFLSNDSNSKMGFYYEAFNFTPTLTEPSPENLTDENLNEKAVVSPPPPKNVLKK
ncbi:hypothetical protein TNCT_478491 [Trichonephila clavata]|uniref:Uncharacterized protein n=1 Tax=Trichonephila clavata TaxID=2740835 RepID=A0A8X6LTK4_TRICU|nr:hypothetical protein TNCT_478491 [Trichonephila clavata]